MSAATPDWRVTLCEPTLDEAEVEAVSAVLRAGWLTQGARVQAFEAAFAARLGAAHAVAVTNCTVALELAYDAVGVGPGTAVLVPALSFVATANAARRRGAEVVFVDVVGDDDLTLDPADAARKLAATPHARALVPMHYGGYAADVRALDEALGKLDARERVALVEDCAHAPGAREDAAQVAARPEHGPARPCGALGALGAFSFFSNKNMTTGEGGMLTARAEALAACVRDLRAHGMTTSTLDRHRGHAHTYDVRAVGTNARLDELRAALGAVQLTKLDAANEARRERLRWYRALLTELAVPGLTMPFAQRELAASAAHLCVVLLPPGTDRAAVMAALRSQGVQSSVHYPPTDTFRAYAPAPALPRTRALEARLLTLPLHPKLTSAQVELVCASLRAALR